MPDAYYNEIDPYAAEWLRNLIKAGLIAPGEVDERDIRDVQSQDLEGFTQCHFFAGIGVWSYALRLAGWPYDRPIWTGSCPCQPFSGAGKRGGFDDERHLWPVWFDLIRKRRPGIIVGEQTSGPDGYAWLDLVQADMENLAYPCGAVVTPAAGYGAPEERHRIYWMAYANDMRRWTWSGANANGTIRQIERRTVNSDCSARGVGHTESGNGRLSDGQVRQQVSEPARASEASWMDHAANERHGQDDLEPIAGRRQCATGPADGSHAFGESATSPTNGFWRDADWLFCRNGEWRPVEPGTFPLAHGTPNRVGKLRAYGNAIVAPQAAQFVEVVMDVCGGAQD